MSSENLMNTACAKIDEALAAFAIEDAVHGKPSVKKPYGNGHINDTFLLCYETAHQGQKRYILQRMNHNIFKNPPQVMENVANITKYLRDMILSRGGNPERETLNIVKTKNGDNFFQDGNGNYWRVYYFIEDSFCLEKAENEKDFYDTGITFGRFQKMLSDYPAGTLHETIPNFHNTPSRFLDFKKAVAKGDKKRIAAAEKEISFALDRERETAVLTDLLKQGKLPLRVTHNDTKLNNVLFDKATHKPLCVIDLDTVMPGLSLYDYGDSIRYGASTGAEDETDLSKIELDLSLFEAFTKGYLEGCDGTLTQTEIQMLPMGAKLMTYECGIRFLADFLTGDTYFKVHRENHNLDRTRTQFRLVADMEAKWDKMVSVLPASLF